jgi:hypothetical protein
MVNSKRLTTASKALILWDFTKDASLLAQLAVKADVSFSKILKQQDCRYE